MDAGGNNRAPGQGALRLRSSDFRREREALWRELEQSVRRVEKKGLGSLGDEELHRLPGLYRAAVSSLSVARAISLDRNLVEYLESLVARAYFCVYGVHPRGRRTVRRFLAHGLPAVIRRLRRPIALAALILVAGVACGWGLYDAELYHSVLPSEMSQGRVPEASTEELRAVLYDDDVEGGELGVFASFLFTNNAKVGMLAFALGFALGLPSVILLFYNGMMLGLMVGLYGTRGLALEFWAWVLPHGVTELLAVCLCGGAGLALAAAIVSPGRYGRLHALARAGREAALVVLGAVLAFLAAGLIEGFFRQLVHDMHVRLAVAGLTAAFWVLYLRGAGSRSSSPAGDVGGEGAP